MITRAPESASATTPATSEASRTHRAAGTETSSFSGTPMNPAASACRERHPEAAGFMGVPLKLDVSVPAARWVRLASEVAGVVAEADSGARVIIYGHVADGNLHVNVVPGADGAGTAGGAAGDGRHED